MKAPPGKIGGVFIFWSSPRFFAAGFFANFANSCAHFAIKSFYRKVR
jgi:hypothetical protein